ncbi:hypothetical protein QM306_40875, partial [Burkholderia cenocepacia]|nr:hypothetical protein [Burkholderia cenocepacia]
AEIVAAGARFGSTVLNCQLFAHHADGHPLSDREVADFYLRAYASGEPVGCLPSLEVHVDMWSEDVARAARSSGSAKSGRLASSFCPRSLSGAWGRIRCRHARR